MAWWCIGYGIMFAKKYHYVCHQEMAVHLVAVYCEQAVHTSHYHQQYGLNLLVFFCGSGVLHCTGHA